jgi:hypothetical protein
LDGYHIGISINPLTLTSVCVKINGERGRKISHPREERENENRRDKCVLSTQTTFYFIASALYSKLCNYLAITYL